MKRTTYSTLILTFALTFLSCGEGEKRTEEEANAENETSSGLITITSEQFENGEMALGKIEKKGFPTIVKTNGIIDVPPENRAMVSAPAGGYIKKTPLLVGDIVKKGQPLVTIENLDFVNMQQEYLEVKGQLDYLKSEYERQKILFEENISSQKNYLKTESEYKTAMAKYQGLGKQLSMLNISTSTLENGNLTTVATIYAPISGSITKVNVSKGTYVSPASAILEVVDNDHIHIELSVFEKDIMKVKKGQHVQFKIPEASDTIFDAEVYLIGTSIDENRTIKVHGHLKDEEEHTFLTGMFVEAGIITDNTIAQAIPSEAVVSIDDTSFVLLLETKKKGLYYFKPIEVSIDDVFDGFTAISNVRTFNPTDQFLTKGAFSLIGE